MSKRRKLSSNNMVSKNKKTVWSSSTPEPQLDSPSHDSDSIYDSDAASPVPFICTQDGTEGETDVVWNFYTPKSDASKPSIIKNTTPLSRKGKKCIRPKLIEKSLPRRRPIKPSQKNSELFQELFELKQNLHEYILKKPTNTEKPQSDEDMFSDTSDSSPKSGLRTSSRCLRKNVLSSKFNKPENGLESDDSMNECLLKASQVVEENVLPMLNEPGGINPKNNKTIQTKAHLSLDQDSLDAILSNVKFDSPSINNVKQINSPRFNNDSFDNLFENLNDSVLERLSQMPVNNESSKRTPVSAKETNWLLKELVVHDGSPTSSSVFARHSSMPESPVAANNNRPSTSGMAFGRYSSMPFNKCDSQGDSPIKCTPEEIKKKHQHARERLIAKRLLPFTSTQQSSPLTQVSKQVPHNQQLGGARRNVFQPKVRSDIKKVTSEIILPHQNKPENDIKSIIEKKRQEAIMKLRKRLNREAK